MLIRQQAKQIHRKDACFSLQNPVGLVGERGIFLKENLPESYVMKPKLKAPTQVS